MIYFVHSVNLAGGYALVSVIKAFCSTAINSVGGVVLDIDPHFATTYNNCRITTKKIHCCQKKYNLLVSCIVFI